MFDCCGLVRPGDCVDLRQFAGRYELGYEDPAFQGSNCPWHLIIKCRRGEHICPSGGSELWATGGLGRCPPLNSPAWNHPECVDEKPDGAFTFHVDDLPLVARHLKAIRRKT
jgi:hypothetical protein